MRKTRLGESDFLVIPEVYASLYTDPQSRPKASRLFRKLFQTPAKKIVFNQNTYNTFNGCLFDEAPIKSIYRDAGVIGTMVVSRDNREYLEYAFPGLKVFRIHNSINHDIFSYCPEKKQQICFMPRKNADHALQVINVVKSRGNLRDFTIIPIENKSERETSQIMKDSLVFLSFGYPEGFSLPPAEAMACGCIVLGYHGMGGREYFVPDYGFPLEMGDIISYAKTIEAVVGAYMNDPGTLLKKTLSASNHIRCTYTKEREEGDVLQFWNSLLGTDC